LYTCFRQHFRGERSAGRPVDQRSRHSGICRGHPVRTTGFTAGVPVSVVPVDPVLSGDRAYHGRGSGRELHKTLSDARMLRQTYRQKNHHAPVRHMDRQLDPGHVTICLQDGTRLLRQKGKASAFVLSYYHMLWTSMICLIYYLNNCLSRISIKKKP